MSNFSFSHSVFKRLVLQTCKKQGLFGKGLIFPLVLPSIYISAQFCCMVEKRRIGIIFENFAKYCGKRRSACHTSVIVYHFTPKKCSIKISLILAPDNNTNRFQLVNPLPNDKFLDWTKFKAFADEKPKIMISVFDNIKTLWEKEKMLVSSIFSFSHIVSKVFLLRVVKSQECVVKSRMAFHKVCFTKIIDRPAGSEGQVQTTHYITCGLILLYIFCKINRQWQGKDTVVTMDRKTNNSVTMVTHIF